MTEILVKSEEKINQELLNRVVVRLMKQDILQRYKRLGEITDEDWDFCEQIDWHPVDELPPNPEHIREFKKMLKEKTSKVYGSTEEFFKEMDSDGDGL